MLDLIIARQNEINEQELAAQNEELVRQNAAKQMFTDTGIPVLWEQIKDIKVPHWRIQDTRNRTDSDNELVPLSEHASKINDLSISVKGWNGNVCRGWRVQFTEHKRPIYTLTQNGSVKSVTKEALLKDFVDYMARLLPKL